ncbi:MAG: hypothetical protein ACYDG4_11475 [Desulfuromonadaceae bacterium]
MKIIYQPPRDSNVDSANELKDIFHLKLYLPLDAIFTSDLKTSPKANVGILYSITENKVRNSK